ncbi:Zn-dependent exopeptidase M28 [Candidatus Woesearchaeota archaeon]|nr:Zn-dependent exopeptidase M28 [Candidatus Woesearchaeota archaeon]
MKLLDWVKEVEGKDRVGREKAVINILEKNKIGFYIEKNDFLGQQPENIIIEFGSGSKEILVTTHYDAVSGSPGANDNGSCISVLIDVARKLGKAKLKNKVKIIIFDLEEPGCLGSRAYVRRHGFENVIGVYNTELCGFGDVVGVWPVTPDVSDSPVLGVLRGVVKKLGYGLEEAAELPIFFGDHRSFRELGFKDAFCLSVIPSKDVKEIRRFVTISKEKLVFRSLLGLLIKPLGPKVPLMFQLYHSSEDKSKYLNEGALQMMSKVIYSSVLELDKR